MLLSRADAQAVAVDATADAANLRRIENTCLNDMCFFLENERKTSFPDK